MIPVFQTIIDPLIGNCQQAAVASLLELTLEDVPHFIIDPRGPALSMMSFLASKGFDYCGDAGKGHPVYDHLVLGKPYRDETIMDGPFPGVDGFFIVAGPSPRFEGSSHAVIWDRHGFVHDPVRGARGVAPEFIKMIYRKTDWLMKPEYRA